VTDLAGADAGPRLLSVNVGMPADVEWNGKTVHTGVWKRSVNGPQMVRRLNIDGDGQGDLEGHGGEQRAVLVYQIASYRYWEKYLGRADFVFGQFGENLTVDGLADDQVCIGDRYGIGGAEFEVTQPRVTCYRVGLRMGEPRLPALLVGHHRPGFYMRVLREGNIEAGDRIEKIGTGPEALSIADTDALLYLPDRDRTKLAASLRIPALSPGWQQSFRELLADHADGTRPDWEGFRPLVVSEVVAETPEVRSIYLAAPDGTPLPPAQPGQYVTLRIRGAGPTDLVRSYSLSSEPGAATYRISVKRESHGAASGFLTANARPGLVVDAAAPRGNFVLDGGPNPVLLLSAGIGVTPVLAMLHALAAASSDRDVWWVHGARRPEEQALAGEAHSLLSSLPHAHKHIFYSAGPSGRLDQEKLLTLGIPASADAYICGPAAFMTDMRQALATIGIDPLRIHTELFGARSAINPGVTSRPTPSPHPPAGPVGTGPVVTFVRSGISTPFTATAANVLELAEACDVPTRWACRTGVCHTCATPLLSGDITYSPEPLERPATDQVLICSARPSTDVVLDL